MKRLALILIVVILSLPAVSAANITTDDLFNEFSSDRKAEMVSINSFMMWLAKVCAGKGADSQAIKNISSVKVLNLEDCSSEVKTRFCNRAAEVKINDMEDLVNVNEDGNKVKILANIKDDKIRKLLVMCYGQSDCCLVEINGNFNLKDLDGVVKSQMPHHNDR